MREDWTPIQGGTPALRLWSTEERDEHLTAVEESLLEATLARAAQHHGEFVEQVKHARCGCREFTGYGAYLHLTTPDEVQATTCAEHGIGEASMNWVASRRSDLLTVAYLKEGRLATLEIFPSDGTSWSVDECRKILAASPSSIVIRALA